MSEFLAFALVVGSVLVAWLAQRAAKRKRSDGETGDLWVRVTWQTACIGVVMVLTTMAHSIPAFWSTGYHPHLDLVLGARWAFPLALSIPFAAWAIILAAASVAKPAGHEKYNWLAGSVGYSPARRWIVLSGLPLLVPLVWVGWTRLNLGAEGYPAGTWGTIALLTISLCFLAISAGEPLPVTRQKRPLEAGQQVDSLKPWPVAMDGEGIAIETVVTFDPPVTRRQVAPGAREFERKVIHAGARNVAPEVIETLHELLSPPPQELSRPSYRLLFAPDNSGQVEAIAMAACDLASSHGESTLIVTVRPEPRFTSRLERWIQAAEAVGLPATAVTAIDSETTPPEAAGIWIVDAATLSDHLLALFSDRGVANRIGMVVWWNIHEYTGVLAANLWAISRRLHRLILARGRPDVRTLALVRDTHHAGSHMPSFVRWLLPCPFPARHEVHVSGQIVRQVQVHLLCGQSRFFERPEMNFIPGRIRHPELVAALVSISQEWPTSLDAHSSIPDAERAEVVGMWVRGSAVGAALRDEISESGARIMHLEEADILALREIVAQGGRASRADLPHHVAITLPDNPYAAWVISRLRNGNELAASRRLVGAEGHPSLFRRHLLLALSEQMDTRNGLMETLLWKEEVVERTLKEIAAQGKLSRQKVVFVVEGVRKSEYLYKSTLARDEERRPLDTVGDRTILVRSVAEGMHSLRVDEARLAIRAYPGRIFIENAARYRVRDWNREDRGWIECQRTEDIARTWRARTPQVMKIRQKGEERSTSEPGLLTKHYPVTLRYQEDVSGYVRRDYDFTRGEHTDKLHHIPALLTDFETSGFVIDFSPTPERAAIHALCQGLRHVLPLHLGVEEDAVEIVPLEGDYVGNRSVFGLVIVDLYPQGIGLVEAICDDPSWTTEILKLTRDWLADVVAEMGVGKPNPFLSPMAKAATGGGENPRSGLDLLRKAVGMEQELMTARAKGGN